MTDEHVFFDGTRVSMKKYRSARGFRIIVHADSSVSLTLPAAVPYRQGKLFLERQREWIFQRMSEARSRFGNRLLARGTHEDLARYENQARALIRERLDYFCPLYGVSWKKLSIRDQKTRWGSCSRQGNMSFNYRVVFLPEHLVDYIVVHELCHRIEFNHSKRFWALVARVIPEYAACRIELRHM
jgi:predicted metal-dependent hydrolase